MKLRNLVTGEVFEDTLHKKQKAKPISCGRDICTGSNQNIFGFAKAEVESRPKVVRDEAKSFFQECYQDLNKTHKLESRWREVEEELRETGTYELDFDELEWAAKAAWRNSSRCAGRMWWKNLYVRDYRHVTDINEAFDIIFDHIVIATNGGNLRPTITFFPPRRQNQPDKLRVWNRQLINFAGYELEDGTIIGDKALVKFTKFCQRLGWRKESQLPQTPFDVLPLVISGEDGVPVFKEIPEDIIMRVKIEHPQYPKLDDLGLEWFALPAVASMLMEVGGLQFPAAPFSGWYSLPEVATRDFMDQQRYDLSQDLAQCFDIDTRLKMWQERVAAEINFAVLHSFNKAKATISDHYRLGEQFMEYFRSEHKERGGCPSDWVWLVPPNGGGLTALFHQEMLNYQLSPGYEYQTDLAATYNFPDDHKPTLQVLLKGLFFAGLMIKRMRQGRKTVYVAYASETGTAKKFALKLRDILLNTLNVVTINVKDIPTLISNATEVDVDVFILSSTFGNGDPPTEAINFKAYLDRLVQEQQQFPNLRYACFALGSSSYPNFCAFGKYVDVQLQRLQASQILPLSTGDELSRQEDSFMKWTNKLLDKLGMSTQAKVDLNANQGHAFDAAPTAKVSMLENYVAISDNRVQASTLVAKSVPSSRFVLLSFEVNDPSKVSIAPGDHMAIFPQNHPDDVDWVMSHLKDLPEEESMVKIQGMNGPTCTFRQMMTHFYDINGALTTFVLDTLNPFMTAREDKLKAEDWLDHPAKFDDFKKQHLPRVMDVFSLFPSLEVPAATFVSSLEKIRPRWYSVASNFNPIKSSKVDLVVSVVDYQAPDGSQRHGLCTRYLKGTEVGSKVYCIFKKSLIFKRAMEVNRPLILIANGSGIAPFRSIWQKRHELLSHTFKITYLFFGCRDKTENLFADEDTGAEVVKRYVAYSREKGEPKKYVQDLILEQGRLICDVLEQQEGVMLVCGSLGMAKGVGDALRLLLGRYFGDINGNVTEKRIDLLKEKMLFAEEIFV